MKLPLLVIAGPTGVGKTAAAVALGLRVPLEIVSADSRQVYRFMDAATGKPTPAERAAVVHHLVDVVDPDGTVLRLLANWYSATTDSISSANTSNPSSAG